MSITRAPSAVLGVLLTLTVLTTAPVARAALQEPAAHFERIARLQGLSHFTVRALAEDDRGFLWIATYGGLERFDGHDILHFRHDDADPTSLSDDRVSALFHDRDGRLWIGTDGAGLNLMVGAGRGFKTFLMEPEAGLAARPNRISSILEDRRGDFWIGTLDGAYRFDPLTGQARLHSAIEGDLEQTKGMVFTLLEDSNGAIWIGRDSGLERFDPVSGEQSFFALGSVRAMVYGNQGSIWVGTTDFGLLHISQELPPASRAVDVQVLAGPRIHSLALSADGDVWIGTRFGLLCFNPGTGSLDHFEHDPHDLHSLSYNNIEDILLDSSGVMWVATWGGGVNRLDLRSTYLQRMRHDPEDPATLGHNEVMSILEHSSGTLWVGTWKGGLSRLPPGAAGFTTYRGDPSGATGPTSDTITALFEDHTGRLWIGTRGGGINHFDPVSERFVAHPQDADPHARTHLIHAIFEDSENILWLGTSGGGLVRFDPATESFRTYRSDPEDPSAIEDNGIWAIREDIRGRLWLVTSAGLAILDRERNSFTTYKHINGDPTSLPHNRLVSLFQDRKGIFWIGTEGGGFARCDSTGDPLRFTNFRMADGLQSDTVESLIEDRDGMIWASTDRGLSRFDPQTLEFRNFFEANGAQESYFVNSVTSSARGLLYFGGLQGITVIDPSTIAPPLPPPRIVLTDLLLANQSVALATAENPTPLKRTIDQTHEVILDHRQFPMAFEFAAMQFADPSRHRFAYKLEGLDRDWIFSDAEHRRASYSQLPPATYTFRVRGANADGIWNNEGATVRLTILPPWWMKWWVRGLALASLAGLAFAVHRMRLASLQRLAQRLELKVAERTSDLADANHRLERASRTDFLTNLPNRRGFTELAQQELTAARRTGRSVTVGMVDLDHFKQVNDTFGHEAGDRVLRRIAELLRSNLRERDLVGRWGGEEFLLLFPETDAEGARVIAEKVCRQVAAEPIVVAGERINVTLTVGLANAPADQIFDHILEKADRALYAGKMAGRNRVTLAD